LGDEDGRDVDLALGAGWDGRTTTMEYRDF
jgi:hypothetical protein